MKKAPTRKVKNTARSKPINRTQSINFVNAQLHQLKFNADGRQVMLRISTAPQGLANGAPPPPVS